MNRRRPHAVLARAMAVLLGVASLLLSSCSIVSGSSTTSSPPVPTSPYSRYLAGEQKAVSTALASVHVNLPRSTGQPAPPLPAGAFGAGVGSHTVLGFLPSWQLPNVANVDYSALSEIGYAAVDVEPHGTILHSGAGWTALANGSVAPMVSDAHAHGVRALLTLFTQTQSTLQQISNDPASAGAGLADRAAALMRTNGFDGVDLDLEGQLASARHGFVGFVAAFSKRLRAIDPSWTIVLNTFPQSAVDPESFFDVKALSPYVDQLFVMAYDMTDLQVPGATAPLEGADLSDASSLASYVATVPPSKVILGIPFYGYDFTASRATPPSATVGSPYAVTYAAVVAAGRPSLWDPTTETPFQSFKRGGHWHQTWCDDPTSVALKVALAAAFKIGGVGAWELGMAYGQTSMTTALDGGSPPRRLPLATQP